MTAANAPESMRMTAAEAAQITAEIRASGERLWSLLLLSYEGQAWRPLGYDSWDSYCAAEFSQSRMVRLDREQRREIVAEMREAGMSTRAIASGLGVHHSTVAEDVQAPVGNPTPVRPITGTDGKTYQPPTPKQIAESPKPFTDRYDVALADLRRVLKRLADLHSDEAFKGTHRPSLGRRHGTTLDAALSTLTTIASDLREGRRAS